MKYLWLLTCALLMSIPVWGQQSVVNKVVAKVGGELILLSEIEEQYIYMMDQGEEVTSEDRCYILESLLAQKLLVNQAKLDSVEVSEEEVSSQIDARIERILSMMNNDVSQFESYYGKTVEQVREQMQDDMRNQMLADRMRSNIVSKATATPSQVIQYFKSIPEDSLPYYNSEVELQELVLKPKVNDVERQKSIDRLEEIKERIIEDTVSFEQMARLYSDDPGSARKGGDLGMMKRGSLVPGYEAAAYNLETGEISDVVESEYGFHLIELIERRGNNIRTRHILIKPEITEKDLVRTRNKLDSIKTMIENDTMTFEQAVRFHGNSNVQSYNNGGRMINQSTGDNFFEVGDLDPDIYFTTDTLEVGEITSPMQYQDESGETQFRIVKLLTRTEPHKASLKTDYAKIQNMAIEQKKGNILVEWLNDKIEETHVEISPDYKYCKNLDRWYTKEEM